MDISQVVVSIRKFGNFLMCLFPFLPHPGGRMKQEILPTSAGRVWSGLDSRSGLGPRPPGRQAMIRTLTARKLSEWGPARWDPARVARTLRGRW
jgi:hypothetical protein